jgi:hypothetical protein
MLVHTRAKHHLGIIHRHTPASYTFLCIAKGFQLIQPTCSLSNPLISYCGAHYIPFSAISEKRRSHSMVQEIATGR